jgi:hypothetical protein
MSRTLVQTALSGAIVALPIPSALAQQKMSQSDIRTGQKAG